MTCRRTWKRLKSYGIKEFLISIYLWIPLLITGYFVIWNPDFFTAHERDVFVEVGTGIAQALIAISLTGLAILVSFSDRDFLMYFSSKGDYNALLFIFEYVVVLSVITTLMGLFFQSTSYGTFHFYIFFFALFHTIISMLPLVSTILRFAESKASFNSLQNLQKEEIPDQLKEDMQDIFSPADSEDEQTTEPIEDDKKSNNK